MANVGKVGVFRQGTWRKGSHDNVVSSFAPGHGMAAMPNSITRHPPSPTSPIAQSGTAVNKVTSNIKPSTPAVAASWTDTETAPSYYPSVAYHGLLREVELCVDVHQECLSESSAGCPAAPTVEALIHGSARAQDSQQLVRRMGDIQSALSRVLDEHGKLYYVGTQPLPSDDELTVVRGGRLEMGVRRPRSGTDGALQLNEGLLSLSAYIDALTDAFCQLSRLRDAAVTRLVDDEVCHHATYIRLRQSPAWKDVNVCLSVEKGRLVLFVAATSRVTQHYLTGRAAELGVELTWIAGATLVTEPTQLHLTDLNPVYVLWDAFVNMPLHPPSAPPPQMASSPRLLRDSTSKLVVPQSMPPEEHCQGVVMILSSLPLSNAHCYATRLRLSDEVPLLGQSSVHDMATSDPVATVVGAPTGGSVAERRLRVGRRYRWRLVGPLCVMHSYLLSHLLRCLIEECTLQTFELHCADVTPWWRHTTSLTDIVPSAASRFRHDTGRLKGNHRTDALPSLCAAHTPLTTHATRGLTYVHGVSEHVSVTRGPSSLSWLGFSRLSCGAWADDATRRRLGLVEKDDQDGGEVELEFEFTPRSIRYAAPFHEVGGFHTELSGKDRSPSNRPRCGLDIGTSFVRPTAWGRYFTVQLYVTQVIALDDDGEP